VLLLGKQSVRELDMLLGSLSEHSINAWYTMHNNTPCVQIGTMLKW
jgi:hypothetical protein